MKGFKTVEETRREPDFLEDKSAEISGITTGKVLTIESKEYTVIEHVQGNQYKVLANELANGDDTMQFGSTNEYATSEIATYLDNDYYNGLDPKIKNAIVETSIQQRVSSTGYDQGKNSPTWTGETKDAGTHKVFIPSWEELTKAAGGITPTILQTFLNSKYLWLRDTCGSFMLYVGVNGYLSNDYPYNICYVRPAFVIDLSKVKYILLEGIKQEENKPFALIKGKATFDRYDIPKVRTSGNVFEASDCKTEVIKTFNTIEEARKELDKYNTNYYMENKDDKTIIATEYCIEENGKKIAFSNRNFTAFVAFEGEDGLKTLTKNFPSNDFGNKAYDCCQEWALKASRFFEEDLSVGVNEWDVKYIDSILTVEEYVKLYDLAHSLNCDDFWVRRRLDKNKKDYLEVTIRNCDDFKYFDVPILNDGEFEGLKLNVQYSSHELELGVEYDQADYEF